MRRAVFLDRDGVIVRPVMENGMPRAPWRWEEFSLFDGVHEATAKIAELDFLRILVTNQPDMCYGNISDEEWWRIHEAMRHSVSLDGIFVCLHGREEECSCKKPKPGLLHAAAAQWNIDFQSSYIIGDTADDMGAGKAVGCTTILISAPYNVATQADHVVENLEEAVLLIERLEGGLV